MARIYTKTGDDGTTGMLHGGRVGKSDDVVEACGDIDEAVAALGLARAGCAAAGCASTGCASTGCASTGCASTGCASTSCDEGGMAELLLRLQRELFVVAADLATNPRQRARLVAGESCVSAAMVAALEDTIDALVAERPLRPVFIVPGSSVTEAALDLARTITRRAERHVIRVQVGGRPVSDDAQHYLNRLSDLLFVLARRAAGDVEEPASHE